MTEYRRRTDPAGGGRKRKRIPKYMQRKLALAFFIVAAALVVCTIRIVRIVKNSGDNYSKIVLSQQNYRNTVLPFRRGTIKDRNQTVLAASERVYNVIIDASILNQLDAGDRDATITALISTLGYNRQELETAIANDPKSMYLRFERQISEERKEAYDSYRETFNTNKDNKASVSTKAVWFETEYKRTYPYNTLACSVLGFSGNDSSQGSWGIEQYYNDYLTGINGREYGYQTQDGTVSRSTKAAQDGNTIISTLDFTIQKNVEEIISQFEEKVNADRLGVLVMDPNNGEILAMAGSNKFDLNDPSNMKSYFTQAEIDAMSAEDKSDFLNTLWRNFMISDTFEPGSTMKALTEAAALEEGIVNESSSFECNGGEQLAVDTYVRCSHNHGDVNPAQALAYSCNDSMMQMADLMGKKVFCKYQDLFGLGKPTGIDLPGEASGLLYNEDNMSVVDLGTNSFGQNFTVTMVQMAAAYGAIINGGNYYTPHVVKEILTADGDVVETMDANKVRQVISETSSKEIVKGLELSVEGDDNFCTGKTARIDGYTVGGKTGTAEKYPRGNNEYLLSFVGFTTVENPQVMVYVIVDTPHDDAQKSAKTAISLERMVLSSIVDYMHISAIDADAWAQFKLRGEGNGYTTDFFGNPIEELPAEPEGEVEKPERVEKPAESESESEPETDKYGKVIVIPDFNPKPKETEYVDPEGDEVIPQGGILDGDDGPPGYSSSHSVLAGTGDDAAKKKK